MSQAITTDIIESKILLIRGYKVLLDKDLAALYGVQPKVLNQAVKRNTERFPDDFMFQLTWEETAFSRSHFVTLKGQNVKYRPYAFTEQGIAMLSSVLHSARAIEVNIEIMRAFVRLRELMFTHKDLAKKIEELEAKFKAHDQSFLIVFDAIKRLMDPPVKRKPKIGFHP